MKSEYLIFTEIIGCGKIGKIALDSFHKYHNYPVHIYGTAEDFKFITPNENNIFIEVEKSLLEKFSESASLRLEPDVSKSTAVVECLPVSEDSRDYQTFIIQRIQQLLSSGVLLHDVKQGRRCRASLPVRLIPL